MTSFVHPTYSAEHVGAQRAVNAIENVSSLFDGVRGIATLLLAATVAAILVAANALIDTWSDQHLFAGWVVLWAVAFAALALFAGPLRRIAARLRVGAAVRRARSQAAAADRKLWDLALDDARVMADINRAMGNAARG